MVRAALPETSFSAMEAVIPRIQRLKRGHRDMVNGVQSPEPSARWAGRNERSQEDGRVTCHTLATSGTQGMWDRLPTARSTATEPP